MAQEKQRLTGGQIVTEYLVRENVKYVFAIPGHGNTALMDAFVDRQDELTVIPAMHEQGASHMADGYYRASGQIAAVCVTIGPGATNTLTGIATAFMDSMPQLVITGAVHTYMMGKGVLQEIDRPHADNFPRMAEPVVKRWFQPSHVEQLPEVMSHAFNAMLEGRRGPVLINFPQDVQAEEAEVILTPIEQRRPRGRLHGDPAEIARAAQLLLSSERPVILAGGGVISAEATDLLVRVAEHLGAPVTTSFNGKGAISEDHELYAWPCGDMGSFSGNAMTREADVILSLGCRFSDRVTSSYAQGVTFDIPNTKLIHVDIDGFEIGKNYPAEVGIVGDAYAVLSALLVELEKGAPARQYRETEHFQRFQDLKEKWVEHLRPQQEANHSPITISQALAEARKVLPRDTIVVTDSSCPQNQVYNEFPVYGPKQHITAGGFSGIGFALPAAIGAKLGAPDKPVVCICGDGAFLQTGQELATAVMMGIPAVFLILNNGGWCGIRNLQLNLFGEDRELITNFKTPDGASWMANCTDFAKSLGAAGERVDDPTRIGYALERALASGQPYVVEVVCSLDRPWSNMHMTGWWDITVPANRGEYREKYEEKRGF